MPSTFTDDLALQQLFQESMSPVTNYSQGLLALAMDRRRQAQQVAQEQRQEQSLMRRELAQSALVLDRQQKIEQMRLNAEKLRADEADRRMMDRLKLQHQYETEDKKEADRKIMVEKANEYGAKLPIDASYETALNAFIKGHGQSYIALNKRAGEAIRTITQKTGMTGQEFAKRLASEIADSPELSKVLTPAERENIRNNPDKIKEIRASFAKNPKKYEAFTQVSKSAMDTVSAAIEKEAGAKPEVAAATALLRRVNNDLDAERRRGGLSPEDEDAALRAYNEAVFPPLQAGPTMTNRAGQTVPATARAGAFPDPSIVLGGAGSTQPAPGAGAVAPAGGWPGVVPLAQKGASAALDAIPTEAIGSVFDYPRQLGSYALFGGQAPAVPAPLSAAWSKFSNPALANQYLNLLSSLRLKAFQGNQGQEQNAIAPTAFPTFPGTPEWEPFTPSETP